MESPIISVQAGTGYGKSVAIKQYFDTIGPAHVLMRLNHLDNIPEQFWSKYTRTIDKINPELAAMLKERGFPFSSSELGVCLRLLRETVNLEKDFCFILDGFHLITEPAILHFLEHALQTEVEKFHIMLVSAAPPHLNLEPLYHAGIISHIPKEELCFTSTEIKEYLDLLDIPDSPGLTEWVYQFSEGWAFAIKLVAFHLKNRPYEAEVSTQVLPTLFDLMDTYAFRSYTQPYKEALTALSFLHTIPLQLVVAITGLSYDHVIELCNSNAFIRYDAGFGSMEIHKIYLRFLKTKRLCMSDEETSSLYNKIATWYYENDYVYEALDFYKKCNRYDKICEIIRDFKNKRLSYDMSWYLLKTMADIPADILPDYRDIPLFEALFFYNNNQLGLAQDILRTYEAKLLKEGNDPETQQLLGETYLILGLIRLFMREPDFTHYFKWADGKLPTGSHLLDHTYPLLEINHGLLCKSLIQTDIEETLAAMDEGFPYLVKLTHGCGAGFAELAHGEYAFLRGHFTDAEKYLYKALFLAREHQQADIILNIYFMLFRIGIARGNPDLAIEYIEKIKTFKEQSPYPDRDYPLIDIAQGWLALKTGSGTPIASWLLSDEIDPADISKRNEGRTLTLHANWLLEVKKSPAEALAYLDKIEKIFIDNNMYTSLVYSYLLKYSAHRHLGSEPEVYFKFIELVYDLINDADLTMFVVENGPATRSALMAYKRYKDRTIPDAWIDRIITKSMTYSKYLNTFKRTYLQSANLLPDISLTENEKSLLDGLCYGLSRAELAKENHISENTVKSQLKSIYNKLDATNQAEAVYIYTTLQLSW